jgi:hypothetical protein
MLAAALLYALAWVSPGDWKRRLLLAVIAGAAVAGFHALSWPQCLQKPEHISPEAQRLWMSYVKEARPVYRHGWRIASQVVAIPIAGAIGWLLLGWVRRRDPDLLRRILAVAAPAFAASVLLLWQTRTGPAAQMMSVVGAAALVWLVLPATWKLAWEKHAAPVVAAGIVATVAVLLVGAGAATQFVLFFIPDSKPTDFQRAIGRANSQCASLWALRPVALQPRGLVFTFVDLGPRLITLTHHNAIAGPYHRNYQQIVDVMKAWRGDERQAYRIMVGKYHADYVLSCPNSSTTTIFMSEAPNGFYGQLTKGRVPAWLQPVELPKASPYRMWKVVG